MTGTQTTATLAVETTVTSMALMSLTEPTSLSTRLAVLAKNSSS